jgi:hypothetical protein
MNNINIKSAQYVAENDTVIGITVVIEKETLGVPLTAGNRHYDEIMRQVEAGTLTIQDAD